MVSNVPAVTAVIPAYNAEATIKAALESVLAQTRADWEAVVVDDGSTDRTAALVHPYTRDPRITVITQENRGLPAARNKGIQASNSPYVAFLDSDDRWMPEYLERMGGALDANPGAGLAFTDAWALDQDRLRIRRRSAMSQPLLPSETDIAIELMRRNFVFVGTLVRRRAFECSGLFNESLRSVEDYEMWLRILAHGFTAVQVPGRLAIKMERAGAMSQNEMRMYVSLRDVCDMVINDHPAREDVRKVARERRNAAQGRIEFLERARGPRWALRRVRLLVGRGLRAGAPWLFWHRQPPPEVAAAFPDLGRATRP